MASDSAAKTILSSCEVSPNPVLGTTGALLMSMRSDMWEFDGSAWTLLGGDDTTGCCSIETWPGARKYAAKWVDASGCVHML